MADLDGDCAVNATDLNLMAGTWLAAGIGDVSGNGVVSFEDFALMAAEWLN